MKHLQQIQSHRKISKNDASWLTLHSLATMPRRQELTEKKDKTVKFLTCALKVLEYLITPPMNIAMYTREDWGKWSFGTWEGTAHLTLVAVPTPTTCTWSRGRWGTADRCGRGTAGQALGSTASMAFKTSMATPSSAPDWP